MGKQARNNRKSDADKQHQPSANSWKCPECSEKFGEPWWNNPGRVECLKCDRKPNTKCVLASGQRHPGLDKDGKRKPIPNKAAAKPAAAPKSQTKTPAEKKLEKELADVKKELAESKKVQLQSAEDDLGDDSMDEPKSTETLATELSTLESKRKHVAPLVKQYADDESFAKKLADIDADIASKKKEIQGSRDPDDQRKAASNKIVRLNARLETLWENIKQASIDEDKAEKRRFDATEAYNRCQQQIRDCRDLLNRLPPMVIGACSPTAESIHTSLVALRHQLQAKVDKAAMFFDADRLTAFNQKFAAFSVDLQEMALAESRELAASAQTGQSAGDQPQQQQQQPQQQQQHMQPDASATTAAGNALVQQHQQSLQQQYQLAAAEAHRVEQEKQNDRQAFAVTSQLAAARPAGVPEPDLATARPCPFKAPAAEEHTQALCGSPDKAAGPGRRVTEELSRDQLLAKPFRNQYEASGKADEDL